MNKYKTYSKKYIKVNSLNIIGGKLEFKIYCSDNIKKYFLIDSFFVKYDQDMNDVDKSILYIPIISNIITAAWAVGADIYVDELDKTYLDSLNIIKPVFEEWYPQFSFSTNIYVEKIVFNQFNSKKYGLLFSGGVDSLASFIRHKDKHPDLFTVWGADISVNESDFWESVRNRLSRFSNQEGVDIHFIKTNMKQMLNQRLLAKDYGLKGWWGPVSHGLILLGLVAPLTTRGIGTILIASTRSCDTIDIPWGSHPAIDNIIAWADVRVVHDGFELTRYEKTKYILKHPEYLPNLRVCYSSRTDYNCGKCEKCLRTITTLILEGTDPANCNFNISNKKILRYIKDCFVKGRLDIGKNILPYWIDIQKHVPRQIIEDVYGSKEFFTWFRDFDLSKYQMNKLRHLSWMISYIVTEKEVKNTIKKLPSFIARRLRHR